MPKIACRDEAQACAGGCFWEGNTAPLHPDGYGYTWFCATATVEFENRNQARGIATRPRGLAAGDAGPIYAGHTDPGSSRAQVTRVIARKSLFAVLGASNYTFAWASLKARSSDLDEAPGPRADALFGGEIPRQSCAIISRPPWAKPLWFEPSLTKDLLRHGHALLTRPNAAHPPFAKPRERARLRRGSALIG